MKFMLFSAIALVSAVPPAISQEFSAVDADQTDLSRYELFEEGQGAITLSDIEAMEDAYITAVDAGDCEVALPLIVAFSDAANRISNILRQGNEPYYNARRDDQETIARNRMLINVLVGAESASNNLIRQRNRAWVEEAKCLIHEGDTNGATVRLYRALDYISSDEDELWEEARNLLWSLIGFTPE
ncbi:hypothetical protein [Octadecabacter sp. R77987]|uniref:hypothetical protein n=1 Tax=Octadecabacter sp. R77987 TaxID=3093874 RepID=UPI00366DCDCC